MFQFNCTNCNIWSIWFDNIRMFYCCLVLIQFDWLIEICSIRYRNVSIFIYQKQSFHSNPEALLILCVMAIILTSKKKKLKPPPLPPRPPSPLSSSFFLFYFNKFNAKDNSRKLSVAAYFIHPIDQFETGHFEWKNDLTNKKRVNIGQN